MKSLLAISPKLPQRVDLTPFSQCLDFLKSDYQLTFVDSLERFETSSFEDYTAYWKNKIAQAMDTYDAFIGFSLGGVLLQNSLDAFYNKNKTIILCSPPSKLDHTLNEKLSKILDASKAGRSIDAIGMLHQYVFDDANFDFEKIRQEPWQDITSRVQFGLGYVLNHRFEQAVIASKTRVFQLVGERSKLVTKDNVLLTPNSTLVIVPNAGNRVLEDNPAFSQAKIKEWLNVK